jgi:hypothetical protein
VRNIFRLTLQSILYLIIALSPWSLDDTDLHR